MTVKTLKLKYADSGFLKTYPQKIKIELYNAGSPILTMQIDKKICINTICYDKLQFNSEFLGDIHYNNILKDIMLFQPIYQSEALRKEKKGFSQSLLRNNGVIFYRVTSTDVTFRDKKHGVYIKIRKLRN